MGVQQAAEMAVDTESEMAVAVALQIDDTEAGMAAKAALQIAGTEAEMAVAEIEEIVVSKPYRRR